MGAHFPMGKPISQAGIAREWGVSAPMVTKYKNKGMPVDDLEGAFNWLAINHPERAIEIKQKRDAVNGAVAGLEEPPEMPDESELTGRGVAAVVARLVLSENMAWKQMRAAVQDNDMGEVFLLTKYYRECAKARLEAEDKLVEHQVKTGELAPVTDSVELLGKVLGIIKTQLAALPYSACARANPTDPELAREAIDTCVEKMKMEIDKQLRELEG